MITEDQSEVVALLASPATHGGMPVETVETHASMVFLAGNRAWKLKRAVKYDYLDFSTAARRREMCLAEVARNRRTAPQLYLGVVPVTRADDGKLALDGPGPAVDWVVSMARFDQDDLLDRLASRGVLDVHVMPDLAIAIADLHAAARPRQDHGGVAGMAWVVTGNAEGFAAEGADLLDGDTCLQLTRDTRAMLDCQAHLLESRRQGGLVRECHGDLHLRNIVLLDGRPTLFDGIEFNDEISCIDVLYDLAFLLVDLWRRDLPHHANVVLNEYVARTQEADGLGLLPLFLSCRAAVRAKTSATAARLQTDPVRRRPLEAAAREYLTLAGRLLAPATPCVVAVGGLSGSGKSTLARALAPHVGGAPGAVVLRSDDVRKRLAGVGPLQRLDARGYSPEMSRRVYASLVERAAAISSAGHSVIVDAVFARPADREAVEAGARAAGVPFEGLWLDAPADTLVTRVSQRVADVSDADDDVVRRQLAADPGPVTWRRLAAGGAPHDVLDDAVALLRTSTCGASLA